MILLFFIGFALDLHRIPVDVRFDRLGIQLRHCVVGHSGGWDKIDGGQCTHAWAMLTGCKEQYTIQAGDSSDYRCFGKYNPNEDKWETLTNSPHDGFRGLWPMKWPEAGGGGDMDLGLSKDDLFARSESPSQSATGACDSSSG